MSEQERKKYVYVQIGLFVGSVLLFASLWNVFMG